MRRRTVLKLMASGLLAGLATISYPFLEAFARPRIQSYRVTPRKWTPGLRLKIAVIADIHACRPWMDGRRVASICRQAQDLQADLILLLGDFMPGIRRFAEPLAPEEWIRPLAALSAPLGVHAILGNHDYWSDPEIQRDSTREPVVAKLLRDVGIAVHINHAMRLEKDGRPFWLAGLGDQLAFPAWPRFDRVEEFGADDMPLLLSQITDEAPAILMAHEPDVFMAPDPRFSLTLSGHTHGGQVNLFGWRPVSASEGSELYPAGHFRKDKCDLIVSRGLGCSSLPLRIGSWPEILLLELGES
ncbi:metallophosphoesterase [Rhizobium sp. FKY42]|uniref:metallophosphoesterase n=1 Tax=Rhizobium sp. FKY42 TaxID=2562310 RepID=UPI001FEF0182|nr:metallophosphoesterase [Rhizobium sp. FKY42]